MKRTPKKEKFDIFNPRPLPTVKEILDTYDFDRENWVLRYKADHYLEDRRGLPLEGTTGHYVKARIHCFNGRRYLWKSHTFAVHRLIWKLVHGVDPTGVIDHINGIRDDNRIQNLRDVHMSVNCRNRHIGLWRASEARRLADIAERDRIAKEAKEARRYARFLKLKAKYEPDGIAHKRANEARAT